ncbi:hypothetical protein AA101099_1372 [Neoasaia chiangmaiensis NBRC 101099]|uniref:Uncharacterized protein n=1 Tax=Neoasaia chiangmaiensis TaxID=320497 RepID=A0A1U9KQF3_9PROT|nr:glycosyltransferase family 2 protein [Neoasaia chiangmaiensis]AQS88038.1 hypothetical protein A0U93_08875 [Neoasaia chiangmaiensis]GBR38805.1 hypothetical protein AA101099_1372 [Neoasaia chiangmaiensis NBRC 101099]GEN15711.1 hypothetical protein NCH01_21420 [Neoasaia chiangmaiensis]
MKINLVACARDEIKNINEWLVFHRALGVDKIYLYCNDDDPTPMLKTVFPFTQGLDPFVEFIHFTGEGEQKLMYKHYINNLMRSNCWIGFIDIDEFITIKNGGTLGDFLAGFEGRDAAHLCWFNFGPGDNIYDPPGFTTQSLTRRNRHAMPHGKVFIKSDVIDRDWISEGYGTFFHGFGDLGLERKHKPFSSKTADIATCWGDDFYHHYETNFGGYAREYSATMQDIAYLSHFQMRSFEHLIRRAKRRISGDFADQSRWRDMVFHNNFWDRIAPDNEVEDLFLRDCGLLSTRFLSSGKDGN